jgi:hypothetical protein
MKNGWCLQSWLEFHRYRRDDPGTGSLEFGAVAWRSGIGWRLGLILRRLICKKNTVI